MYTNTFKRFLIINDDDDEKIFFTKYKQLEKYENLICYCNTPNDAFKHITSDDFGGFDKIVLDIKIDWTIPQEYKEKILRYMDINEFEKVNNGFMGFMIFMYLILRGYPIDRIAFLSAYINEVDNECKYKKELIDKIGKFKTRNQKQDNEIIELSNKIPSLNKRILHMLDNNNNLRAYKEISELLSNDISAEEISFGKSTDSSTENTETFFALLKSTGIRVGEKINKSDSDKLEKWISNEKSEKLRAYYMFRNEILNICEFVNNLNPSIYKLYNQQNKGKFKTSYPKDYFENLMLKIQKSVLENNSNIDFLIESILNNLIKFWENIDKKHINSSPDPDDLNNHAITMVLKNTRNWYVHGRLQEINISFCRFIFLLSIRVIYGKSEKIAQYLEETYIPETSENLNSKDNPNKIWLSINKSIMNINRLNTNTYTLNLEDLYYKFSNDTVRENITLKTKDLIEMFILCLHYPYIENIADSKDRFKVNFNEIDYKEQEKLLTLLERMSIDIIKSINTD